MQQRLRLSSKNFQVRPQAVAAVEIVQFKALETPFGLVYWNPNKAGVAVFAAGIGAVAGLFAGAYMGLSFGEGLGPALLTLTTSAVTSVLFALNALRA